jgi:dehydrogenase/reductase SDR family member 12
MTIKDWVNQLLDLTIFFSFDRSGFKRHCSQELQRVDLSGRHGIVTGASSGIGLAVAKALLQQRMDCQLIGRDLQKLETSFNLETAVQNDKVMQDFELELLLMGGGHSQKVKVPPIRSDYGSKDCINLPSSTVVSRFKSDQSVSLAHCHRLDMTDLNKVYSFAVDEVTTPIDLLIHNAGDMPHSLTITKDGFEEMFASQVLAPFILTKTLADLGKLQPGCRIIFVSSGGMYLQKLDLSNLLFEKNSYNKYTGYANAKRAQVILSELFSKKYPQYLFSSMHPGWADTPGVRYSMPLFRKVLNKRLRSAEEGADTILWLATTPDYPNGKFWFDRKEANTTILNLNKSSKEDDELLWKYCESLFASIKGRSS